MNFFNLGFLFRENCVFLIDSHRFPGKFNGVGSERPYDMSPTDSMFADFAREAGIVLSLPVTDEDLFAYIEGPSYVVSCYRFFDDAATVDVDKCENPNRFATMIPVDALYHIRHQLAPRTMALIGLALDTDLDPVVILDS